MSIGKKSEYITLESVATGEVFKFNIGKMHIQSGDIMIDAEGDDVVKTLYNKYGVTNNYLYFRFNKLMGCFLRYYCDNPSYVGIDLYISGHEHESRTDYHKTWGISPSIEGVSNYGNYVMCGMYFAEMANNELIQGPSVYMFPFIAKNNNGILAKGSADFPYKMPVNYNQKINTGDGYLYSPFSNSFTECPYILKNYNQLGFSDSGDIKKQYVTTEYGFPFGPDESGESKSQGGHGDMVDTTEIIDIDSIDIPQSIKTSGLVTVWKLEKTQLDKIAEYVLDDSFSFSKFRADPMDYLIDLKAMPFNVTDTTEAFFTFGGALFASVYGEQCNSFIYDFDMGYVDIPVYFDTFLDYSPFTKGQIYLPYIGISEINLDLFVGKRIHVVYRVDILTGVCVALISDTQRIVQYEQGIIGYSIPLRSKDKNDMLNGLIGAASSFAFQRGHSQGTGVAINVGSALQSAFKPTVTQNNKMNGNFGVLCNRKPYLIIERPRISMPPAYASTKGYVSKISTTLGTLRGFTKVEDIHLEHTVATDGEKDMIVSLLKEGVIL